MPPKMKMSPGELRNYILTWAGKKDQRVMEDETGVNLTTIQRYAKEMEVSLILKSKIEQRQRIIDAILANHDNMTAREIAIKMKVTRSAIFQRGWRMGIKFKPELSTPSAEPIEKTRERMFNVHTRSNWLV